jgi:cytidylate kinase
MHREISPLIMCEDAYLIDSTLNTVNDCIELALAEMVRRELITREQLKEMQ